MYERTRTTKEGLEFKGLIKSIKEVCKMSLDGWHVEGFMF